MVYQPIPTAVQQLLSNSFGYSQIIYQLFANYMYIPTNHNKEKHNMIERELLCDIS